MKLIKALLENLFGEDQCGGVTMSITVSLFSPTECSSVRRYSTCGGDETAVKFDPPLPLEEALLHSAKYTEKGVFVHK
jgi:hypothetical protein